MPDAAHRIDVHHHFLPPDLVAALEREVPDWTGGAPTPAWDVAAALGVMERNGIATAVASIPFLGAASQAFATRWARECNEFLARRVADEPARFGGFACLPLPDAGAACAELEHALDTLHLDGVLLMSSTGDRYPGDPDQEELFAELERRAALVFIHPSTNPPGSGVPRLDLPRFLAEFVFDTTRCITSLLYSGTFERYPSIRYIVAHAGGTVPYLAWRLSLGSLVPRLADAVPKGPLHYLKRLWFDTALSASDHALASLLELVGPERILFGSDWPMAPEPVTKASVEGLATSRLLDPKARRAIERESALALLPRLTA